MLEFFWYLLDLEIAQKISETKEGELYISNLLKRVADYHKNQLMDDDPDKEESLTHLQRLIEERTMGYNEWAILNENPELVKILIPKNLPTAKTYLAQHLSRQPYMKIRSPLGTNTLEEIRIFALGIAFSSINDRPIVRIVTLLDILIFCLRR